MSAPMITVAATILLVIMLVVRLLFSVKQGEIKEQPRIGVCQTTGSKDIQSDLAMTYTNQAGTMAVMADGIGRENTGKVCAQIVVDTILDRYEPYHALNNPDYFFKSTFREANRRIQLTIGDRRGGANAAAVFVSDGYLYYAAAGYIRIAFLRGQELIPLNRGQTVDVLAAEAYQAGTISRQEAIWSMDEKRTWNYLGMDGFREIEKCEKPIRLKCGDIILIASKGIFEELSWGEIEDLLLGEGNVKERGKAIVRRAEEKPNPEKDNGSVLLLEVKETEAEDEKD